MSATTRCLGIPEITIAILNLCERSDLGTLARTCRDWSPLALDQLWENLNSIVPLLLLVRPLHEVADDETGWMTWEFDGNVADTDWTRFREYASRVRSLRHDENDHLYQRDDSYISFTSIQALSFVHPFGTSLLPKLQRLSWCCVHEATRLSILPFVSPSLRYMHLDIERGLSAETSRRLLRSLAHRTPELQNFRLSTSRDATDIDDFLIHFFHSTPELQLIALPQYYHTPKVLETLGRLEKLKGLETDWLYQLPDYLEEGTVQSILHFPQGSFRALESLHFHSSLAIATQLFTNPGPSSQLAELCFVTRKCHPYESLRTFLSSVGRACPHLRTLSLNFSKVLQDDSAPNGPLTLEEIRSCLSVARLQKLLVAYDLPLILGDMDIVDMSNAWKHLRYLRLCSDPNKSNHLETQEVLINIFKTFSEAMPELEYLSLYFNQTNVPQFTPHLELVGGFKGRLEIDVGLSLVLGGEENIVGFFIGSLCQRSPQISATQTDWTICNNFPGPERGHVERWGRVEKLAGMICEAKRAMNNSMETLCSQIRSLQSINSSMQQDETTTAWMANRSLGTGGGFSVDFRFFLLPSVMQF